MVFLYSLAHIHLFIEKNISSSHKAFQQEKKQMFLIFFKKVILLKNLVNWATHTLAPCMYVFELEIYIAVDFKS